MFIVFFFQEEDSGATKCHTLLHLYFKLQNLDVDLAVNLVPFYEECVHVISFGVHFILDQEVE